jgi:hypothetical protein
MECAPPGFFDFIVQPSFFLLVFALFVVISPSLVGWLYFASLRRSVASLRQGNTLFLLERLGTALYVPGLFILFLSIQWWFSLDDWHTALVDYRCLIAPDAAAYGQTVLLCIALIVLAGLFSLAGIGLVVYSRMSMQRLAHAIEPV